MQYLLHVSCQHIVAQRLNYSNCPEIAAWVAFVGRILMALAFVWAAASVVYDRFILTDTPQSA
jgi:hypothetical protein